MIERPDITTQQVYESDIYIIEKGSSVFLIEKDKINGTAGQFITNTEAVDLLNNKSTKVCVQLSTNTYINNFELNGGWNL